MITRSDPRACPARNAFAETHLPTLQGPLASGTIGVNHQFPEGQGEATPAGLSLRSSAGWILDADTICADLWPLSTAVAYFVSTLGGTSGS